MLPWIVVSFLVAVASCCISSMLSMHHAACSFHDTAIGLGTNKNLFLTVIRLTRVYAQLNIGLDIPWLKIVTAVLIV